MKIGEILTEAWSQKYKSSINCSHPRGFSQKAHCAGKKKHNESVEMEMVCEDCGMCETHGDHMMEVKQRLDAKCWKGKHKEGTKIKGGVRVNNCVPKESKLNEFAPSPGYGDNGGGSDEGFPRKPQQFNPGDVVWIAADPPKYRGHFPSNCPAIVMYSYESKYGGGGSNVYVKADLDDPKLSDEDRKYYTDDAREEANKPHDYGLLVLEKGDVHESAWFTETDLTLIPKGTDPVVLCSKGNAEPFESLPAKAKTALIKALGQQGISESLSLNEQFDVIEEMVESLAFEHGVDADVIWEDFESVDDHELLETAAWRRKEGKSKKGGLNAKGVASYRRENPGSKLQMAVTTKPSKLKKGSKAAKRRKSFCARMGGVKGPMKKPNGKPTRKALALRKWNC